MSGDPVGLTAEQYDALLDQAEDVVFLLDREQRYVGIWGRWMAEHDLRESDFLGRTSWDIFGPETREFFESINTRVLAGERLSYDRWFDTPWGEKVFYQTRLSPMRDTTGHVVGIVGIGRDITDLKEAHDRLEHAAMHDPLTDLPNRVAFQHAVDRLVAKAARGVGSTLLFVDLDDFKACNDRSGHGFGDVVLTAIARALRNRVREPDIVARIGGDEFGVALEGTEVDAARAKAGELRDVVRELGAEVGYELDLSVGIAPVTADATFESALAEADRAMYAAKSRDDIHVVVAGGG